LRLDTALDPEAMRALLGTSLRPLPGRQIEIRSCRPGPAQSRQGYRYSVRYDLAFRDGVAAGDREAVVTGTVYGGKRTRQIWEGLRDGPFPAPADGSPWIPFGYVPELDMLLQVFPHDHALPALARLLAGPTPELEPALLATFGAGRWRTLSWTAESVRYRVDQRATVRLSLGAADGGSGRTAERRLFAKVYRDEAEGRRAHQVLGVLAAAGERFTVPEPVAYVPALRTAVQGEVPGTPLLRILRRERDATAAVRLAARALAAFHRVVFPPDVAAGDPPPRSLSSRIARLERAGEELAARRPDLRGEIDRTIGAIKAALAGGPTAPTHGDLKPDHFYVEGERVALIDFDLLRISDPILDVATVPIGTAKPTP
jgi:hypothetical protein